MKLGQASQQEILKALAKATGAQSQRELAELLGVHQASVCKWNTGSRTMLEPIRRLALRLIAEAM